jgi:hypothetical protein
MVRRSTNRQPGRHSSQGSVLAREKIRALPGGVAGYSQRLIGVRSGKPLAGGVLDRILSGHLPCPIAHILRMEHDLGVPAALWARLPKPSRARRRVSGSAESSQGAVTG